MKKFYLLIGAGAIMVSANAQNRSVSSSVRMSTVGLEQFSNRALDTLEGNWEFGGTPTLSGSVGGGYVAGNNGYGDLQKAQVFQNFDQLTLTGALIWFGAKNRDLGGSATSKVQVRAFSMNGTGQDLAGTGSPAPGTILASTDILFTDIDTGTTLADGLNVITFASGPWINGVNFAIGVNFATLAAGDTVGMVHSADGDAGGTDLAWEQWSNSAWYSMAYSWPLDIDFFIFATINTSEVGVEELSFINGGKLYQNQPNPANGNTTIIYELEKSTDNVSLYVFDATGKAVATFNEGNKPAGKFNINLSTANLQSGVYYYALSAGDCRIAQKMIVE